MFIVTETESSCNAGRNLVYTIIRQHHSFPRPNCDLPTAENISGILSQKSFPRKETSTNMFQFRISNVPPDATHLKFSVSSEFQRYLIPRRSFKESCLQNINEGYKVNLQSEAMGREHNHSSCWESGRRESEFVNERERKTRGGGISGSGKSTNEEVPRLSASLGKTTDSIKNQSHKSTQISQTKHNWAERWDPIP